MHPRTELGKVGRLLEHCGLVTPDRAFASVYGEMECAIRRSGTPIPTMDLLIGCLAKQYGMPLLTRDTGHYERMAGLQVETY